VEATTPASRRPTLFEVPAAGAYERARAVVADVLVYNAGGARPPLVVIRTWSSEAGFFRALAGALGPDQPVYSIAPPDFPALEAYPRTTDEWVDWLWPAFRSLPIASPFRLGGWSFGGVVALELAERLEQAGEPVALVLMLDSRRPKARPETKPGVRMPVRLRKLAKQLLAYSELESRRERLAYVRERFDPLRALAKRRARRRRIAERGERDRARADRRRTEVAAAVAEAARDAGAEAAPEAPPDGITTTRYTGQQMTFLQRTVHVAYLKYRSHPTELPIALLRTRESVERSGDDPALGWWPFARGRFSAETIEGTHWTMFEPAHLPGLAVRIERALAQAGDVGRDPQRENAWKTVG